MTSLKDFVSSTLTDLCDSLSGVSEEVIPINFDVAVNANLEIDAPMSAPTVCRLRFTVPVKLPPRPPAPFLCATTPTDDGATVHFAGRNSAGGSSTVERTLNRGELLAVAVELIEARSRCAPSSPVAAFDSGVSDDASPETAEPPSPPPGETAPDTPPLRK